MESYPRITIVTPSYNQGRYIGETIESVKIQAYPNLEHIVVDGGSTDETLEILKQYPDLIVISEPDRGLADAINKGFKLATGEIWGYLCSDDTLLPGALFRIAQEIDPNRDRHIVMGRCRFTDSDGRYVGIEHPSHFESHKCVLEIWKGHTIPQPAVFWIRDVWKNFGVMREDLASNWIDYDLFCRFSKRYRFWFVDQVFATYRLHSDSKTQLSTEEQCLEECIQISQSYWGSPLMPFYWQIAWSLIIYRFNRVGRARKWWQKARDTWRHRQFAWSVGYAIMGGLLAPEVVFYAGIYPFLREHARGIFHRILDLLARKGQIHPQTQAYMDHLDMWSDGWAGPRVVVIRNAKGNENNLKIDGFVYLLYLRKPFVLSVLLNGRKIGEQSIKVNGDFELTMALPNSLPEGSYTIDILSNVWFVPNNFTHGDDYRPLAWRILNIGFT